MNILSALLAKRMGARHTVALVNMPQFVPLISALGVDAVINPPMITVSSILEHVRRGRILDVHSVVEELGEVLEAEALPYIATGWHAFAKSANTQRGRYWGNSSS